MNRDMASRRVSGVGFTPAAFHRRGWGDLQQAQAQGFEAFKYDLIYDASDRSPSDGGGIV
jgi:hypothetical protein